MRPRVGKRVVTLPAWVSLTTAAAGPTAHTQTLVAECSRCGRRVDLSAMTRQDAEQQLGQMARWHRRCVDRSLFPKYTGRSAPRRTGSPYEPITLIVRRKKA